MNRLTLIAAFLSALAATILLAGTADAANETPDHGAHNAPVAAAQADEHGRVGGRPEAGGRRVVATHADEHDRSPEHGQEHGHGAEPSLNPLDFRSDTAIWTLVIFLIVVAVLGKFAFRPIADALDAREKAVADQIASANQANEEAKNVLAQYQQRLSDSKDEVRQILETARADAQRSAEGIIEKARQAAKSEHDRAMKEISSATANALQSIAEKSATLATNLAGKMIRKEVSPESHRELIRVALDEFAKN